MALREMLQDAAGRKFCFDSTQLPATLSDAQKRGLIFDDIFAAMGWASDFGLPDDDAADVRLDGAGFGATGILRAEANVSHWRRTRHHIAGDNQDIFQLGLNVAPRAFGMAQAGREVEHAPGETLLFRTDAPLDVQVPGGMAALCLSLSVERLRERVAGVDDLLLRPLDAANPALRHLWRYAKWILEAEEPAEEPMLATRVETMLLDLAVLALDAGGEAAEIAAQRGLRLARLREVLAAIRRGYAVPGFGPAAVAAELGLSQRYVQDLLHQTGRSFSERVLELRLQHALRLLTEAGGAQGRIIDIALASGFNDISYFNRAFRRRFGQSPGAARYRPDFQ